MNVTSVTTIILLYIFCAISLTLGDTLDCCETKENGGTIYKLVQVDRDITNGYKCKDGCIYEDTNEDDSRICFRNGGEHISTCDVGETESVLTISENGQEVKQTVSFNNYTGILTIDVPPHISVTQENFTQATTTFDTKTNTNVIKSNNSCVISDIPSYLNVTGIPEYFQQVKDGTVEWDNENKEIAYDVKMVKSVVSPVERKALSPALDSLCNNEVIKKTENKLISKDNYKKLMNDEIIFIGEESENTQSNCSLNTSCTSKGPASCGNYGWYNPTLKKYITMHQVSSKSLCMTCCVETSPQCNCTEDFPEFCPCSKITTKEIFMDCLLGNGAGKYKLNFQDSAHTLSAFTQLLTYNSKNDARSVKIEVPSHGDVSETTVLMHAHTDGYWHTQNWHKYTLSNNMMMKVGSTCYIRTLPENMFPIDIATGIKDIDAGNFVLTPQNEKKKHTVIRTDRPLTSDEKQKLNLEINEICKNSEIFNYEEIEVGEVEFETGIMNLKNNEKTKGCSLETRATTNNGTHGCWRWPNPDGGQEISVHGLVSSVVEVKCCNDPCCKDSGFCQCKDITDIDTFQRCFSQTETPYVHVDCYVDPLGKGKCPENSGCFNDELGQYGAIGQHGFCHCFLGFYSDSSANPPMCKDMRGGGNCDEHGNSHICYEDHGQFEWCPYCSVKKLREDHGGELSLGHYVSGEGDFNYGDPQVFKSADAENCPEDRYIEAFWYCWYDAYDELVQLDTVEIMWAEPERCSFVVYAYTPLACCFADPLISDPAEECW